MVNEEVKQVLGREASLEQAKIKSREFRDGKRDFISQERKAELAQSFDVAPFLEWVSKDCARGFQLILARGEFTRLFADIVSKDVK